jgi:hypothetical protein
MVSKTPGAKTEAKLELLEEKLEEATEAYKEMDRLRVKLLGLKRGSDPYFDVVAQLSVAAIVLAAKCESVDSITDEIIDTLPED